jgi:xanthine dehydrogenase accessory factor
VTAEMAESHAQEPSIYDVLRAEIKAERPVALATLIRHIDPNAALGAKLLVRPGHDALGTLGEPNLDRVVARDAAAELAAGLTSTRHYGEHGEARREEGVSVFIESFSPPPRMIIFGAVDFTAALVRAAKLLGYNVIVCDARPVFATKQRFPLADDVVNDWPDRYLDANGGRLGPLDAICVLTHDPKFDVPAIVAAVKTGVGYLGAMGSRRTTVERAERLRDAGLTDAEIARVMGPIGLDIGSRTPEETAISIVAEIIALRTGRAARGALASLRDLDGPIHVRA